MQTSLLKFLKNQLKIISSLFLIMILLIPITAESGESLWDKGTDLLKGYGESSDSVSDLSVDEMGAGLKEALLVGSKNVVRQLGGIDGFNADPDIHIPLPKQLDTVKSVLEKIGMSNLLDDLELKLNRAAEASTPKAKKLFKKSISEMTFDDVKTVYDGPDDAATQYFKDKMALSLSEEMSPVVSESLSEVGAIKAYDNAIKEYQSVPFVPDSKTDLTEYVVDKGMDGIFYYMAIEEAAIRKDPAKQTTDLLKRVFGSK
ncbi:MAG: DUF4197 domain-containing protein [Desulfobacterales bacterium]|nr:DUF4197 domain-containing protein [Desulfobacterales bacterium]